MNNNEFLALSVTHKIEKISAKKVLYSEGVPADAFYAIVSGSVLLTEGNKVVTAPVTIGFEDVLLGGGYSCSVIAINEVSFIKVDKSKQANFIKLCPGQAMDIIRRALGCEPTEEEIEPPKPAEKIEVMDAKVAEKSATDTLKTTAAQTVEQRLEIAKNALHIPPEHKIYGDSVNVLTEARFLHKTEHVCPVCNMKFEDKTVLFSLLRTVKTDLDLRVHFQEFDPLWYAVVACPRCKYANTEKKFTDIGSFEAKSITDRLSASGAVNINEVYSEQRNIDDIFIAFYDALFCTESLGDNSIVKATLWLNLVWLYEDVGDSVMVDISSRKALDAYNYIYKQTRLFETPEEEQQIFMILAELHCRIGEKRQAMNFLSEAFRSESSNRVYKEKCRRRFDDLKYAEEQ